MLHEVSQPPFASVDAVGVNQRSVARAVKTSSMTPPAALVTSMAQTPSWWWRSYAPWCANSNRQARPSSTTLRRALEHRVSEHGECVTSEPK